MKNWALENVNEIFLSLRSDWELPLSRCPYLVYPINKIGKVETPAEEVFVYFFAYVPVQPTQISCCCGKGVIIITTIEQDGIVVKVGMIVVNNILALTATVLLKNVWFTFCHIGVMQLTWLTNVAIVLWQTLWWDTHDFIS